MSSLLCHSRVTWTSPEPRLTFGGTVRPVDGGDPVVGGTVGRVVGLVVGDVTGPSEPPAVPGGRLKGWPL
jgi:hypothetical protein